MLSTYVLIALTLYTSDMMFSFAHGTFGEIPVYLAYENFAARHKLKSLKLLSWTDFLFLS
jgi:hypothetical protein